MMSFNQLNLLLRKEFIVMWRNKLWTVFEIAIPLLISFPLIIFLVQKSSSQKHEAQFWQRFQVTGDWRDVDRRVDHIQTIYKFCGGIEQRKLAVVFPNSMDKKEALKVARELENRYSMNKSVLHSHDFKLNVIVFPTEAAMMEILLKDLNGSFRCTNFIAGIIFNEYNSSASRLSYTMRVRRTDDPQTRWYIGDEIWRSGGPYEVLEDESLIYMTPNYWSVGILSLQYAIDSVFVKEAEGKKYSDDDFDYSLAPMPEPSYFEKTVVAFLSFLIFFWQLFTLPTVLHTASNIAFEKYSGMKAFLKVMGLHSFTFYLAHAFVAYLKIMVVLLTSAIILLPQFQLVSSWLFITTIFLYGAGAVAFALLMSSFFHSPNAATKGTVLIWLAAICLTGSRESNGLTLSNFFYSLNINSAFTFAMESMQDYMNRDELLCWYNMFENATYMYPLGLALGMMTFDAIWMSLLAIYLDNIYPCGDLPRKHWLYFIGLPWRKKNHSKCVAYDMSDAPDDNIQQYDGNDQADIDIRQLTKTYATEPVVNKMSFRAHRGEITVLLGHNGAGKSTTLSMITGLIAPSSGSIYICGDRMGSRSTNSHHHSIGYCPQYNALFDSLTVREHLEMFRKMSGNPNDCVDEIISDVHLDKEADMNAGMLSGGLKRKLCVGISLICGGHVVVLDEPTAGMDPSSRHHIARLLEQYKRERTILLTTHYMDEADSLGDRIAIMVKGRLICSGTSGFLKSRFGTGYLLSIDLMHRPTRGSTLLNAIKDYIPKTKVQSGTPQQLTVLLPSENKNSFPNLFAYLERNVEKFGINSFGLSLNTLEQVFLRVGEIGEPNSTVVECEERLPAIPFQNSLSYQTGMKLWFGQLCALLRKRMICYWKHWPRLIAQIFLPLILLSLTVIYIKGLSSGPEKRFELLLSADRIKPSVVLVQEEDQEALFSRNVQAIVQGIAGYSYVQVPSSQDMAHYLANTRKIPPPLSIAVSSSVNNSRTVSAVFFNARARYGPIIATNLISNARLGHYADSIKISFFPYGNVSDFNPLTSQQTQVFLIGPVLIVIFAFMSSGFVAYVVDELSTNFMCQQLHTGLNAFIYWVSVSIADSLLYGFTCFILMLIIVYFGRWLTGHMIDLYKPFCSSSPEGQPPLVVRFNPTPAPVEIDETIADQNNLALLWLIYLWPTMPLVYCMAFMFKQSARAYTVLIILTLVVALCANILSYISITMKPDLFPYLHSAFLFLLPTYGMSYGLALILNEDVANNSSNLYDWEGLKRVYFIMTFSGLILWIILWMINCKFVAVYLHNLFAQLRGIRKASVAHMEEDSDVKEERIRISRKKNAEVPLAVRNLNKYYGKLHAVCDLTFGIESGECFGLLGVNGAGKTTTFDMLTGVSLPDVGQAFINGRSILEKQIIGFCPQFDALHPELTARQTLQLMASLCGFSNSAERVQSLLEALSMMPYADNCVKHLSGGQRRRLSLGVALISQVGFILLDEPTAGIDPKARRQIWNLLSAIREKGRAILLTSHSMIECEALCTRIGIMDHGTLIAIGTPQHIKTKFGEKYTMSITIDDVCWRDDLINAVRKIFPDSVEKSTHRTQLSWDIKKKQNDRWSEMYGKICQLAAQYTWITDYSLAQGSLEEAFLRLSRREDNDDTLVV